MLKRLTVITLAILALMAGSLTAEETAKAPRLTVTEPVKDFGTVAKGAKLNWAFQVKNTGTSDLEITAARPACGCTVAEFDKVIKPGETGKVVANVDTANFTGPIAKSVTIETNDTANPSAQITIHAIVKPYVEAFPAGFVRYNLLQGDAAQQSLTLYSEEEEPFEITKIEVPGEWVRAEYVKLTPEQMVPNVGRTGQAQYRVNITVGGPDAKIGPLADKVRILTNSKNQPEYPVSITGVIRPSVTIMPTGINFGEVAPTDTAATRSVVLKSNNSQAPETFVVTKAESNVPAVKANVKPTANKGEYEVTLQVDKNAKPGDINGAVKIYTTDKANSVVTITLKGTIKSISPQASK